MGFADAFKQERLRIKYTQQQMAEALNVSPSTVGMWEQGRRIPDFEKLEEIADFYNINLEDLRGNECTDSPKPYRIPVLGSVPAGIPLEAIEDIVDYEDISETMAKNGEYFGLRVSGESMIPVFNNGDTVIIQKQESADTGDYVVAMINGNEATLKKLKRSEEGIMLIPSNPEYFPATYTNEQILSLPVRIIGKVVELRRKF